MPRYIDADKLIQHLKDEMSECAPPIGGRANGKSVAYGTMLGLKMAISFAETLSEAPDVDVAPRAEVAREIIGEVFSYVHGNEKLTENIPETELFKFGMFIGELEKKYDPKSKKIITDNTHQE